MKTFIWMLLIGLIVLLAACSSPSGPGQFDTFAKCLTEKDATFYGTQWCPHCNNQKEMFGDSMQYVHFVDCDKYKDECIRNQVQAYPTWKIKGETYTGVQPLTKLAELSGCELTTDAPVSETN